MKMNRKTCIIIVLALLVLTLIVAVPKLNGANAEAEELLKEAQALYEENLCKRSLNQYVKLLSLQEDLETRLAMMDVYSKGMKNGEFTRKYEFVDFMLETLDDYRKETRVYEKVLTELMELEDYEEAANVLKKAESFGIMNNNIAEVKKTLRGKYNWRYSFYESVYRMPGEYYLGKGKQYTILNPSLTSANDISYDYLSPVAGGGALAITDAGVILMTVEGVRYAYFDPSITESTGLGDGLIACKKNGKYGYYNPKGEYKFGSYDFAGRFANGVAAVRNGENWELIGTDGNAVIAEKFEDIKLSEAMDCAELPYVFVKKNGSYTIFDLQNKQFLEFSCDEADCFLNSGGIAAFRKGEKWGFVDTTGSIVIEPSFVGAKSFSNGLAGVQDGEFWKFIDKNGDTIISGEFLDVEYFTKNGQCFVEKDGFWTSIELYYH